MIVNNALRTVGLRTKAKRAPDFPVSASSAPGRVAIFKIYAPWCKFIRNRVKIRFLPLAGSGPERGWMRLAGVPVFRSYAAFTGVDPWSVNRSIG